MLRTYEFNKDFKEYVNLVSGQSSSNSMRHYDLILEFPWNVFQNQKDYEKLVIALETIRIELYAIYGENFLDEMDIVVYEINNHKDLNCYQSTALFLIYIHRFVNTQFY